MPETIRRGSEEAPEEDVPAGFRKASVKHLKRFRKGSDHVSETDGKNATRSG